MTVKHKLTDDERVARRAAAYEILLAANASRPIFLKPFGMRTIQQAVFKCRQFKLVKPMVLAAAGYRERA